MTELPRNSKLLFRYKKALTVVPTAFFYFFMLAKNYSLVFALAVCHKHKIIIAVFAFYVEK
jgi:hypothetical protein